MRSLLVMFSVVVCLNLLFVASLVSAECDPDELLSCEPVEVSSSVLCCNESAIVCVEYSGTSVGSQATYNTSDDYCITTDLVRTCTSDMDWDGQTPSPSKAYEEQVLSKWNPTLVYLGLSFFGTGVIFTIASGISVYFRRKKCGGTVAKWYVILMSIQQVNIAVSVVFWLALLGYGVSRDFTRNDGYLREADSSCRSPSGEIAVRNALVIICFTLANFAQSLGITILASMRSVVYGENKCGNRSGWCGNKCGKNKLGEEEKGNQESYPQPM